MAFLRKPGDRLCRSRRLHAGRDDGGTGSLTQNDRQTECECRYLVEPGWTASRANRTYTGPSYSAAQRITASASYSSAGAMTTMFGIARMIAKSSMS